MDARRKLSSAWTFGVSRGVVAAVVVVAVAADSLAQAPPTPDAKSVQEMLAERERAWVEDIVARKDGQAGPNNYGRYPILVLIGLGDVEGLKVLLEAGADPDKGAAYAAGLPLAGAIRRQDREMVRLLLAHGASVQREGEASYVSAFALALKAHDDEIADAIMKAAEREGGYFRLNKAVGCRWIDAALSEAANEGSAEWCAKLLGLGANPNAPYLSSYLPIHMAAGSGSVETARVLLDAGALPSAKYSTGPGQGERTALAHALGSPKAGPEMIQLLLDRGAGGDLSWNADALFSQCVQHGSMEKLRVLMKAHPVSTTASMGAVPLLWAIRLGRLEAVQALLDAGAITDDIPESMTQGASTLLALAESLAKAHPNPEREEIVRLLKAEQR